MCGICGYLAHAEDSELLLNMSEAIAHRGPDDSGIYQQDEIGLAHRRLSIIDITGGHQPMISDQGEVLVYNGEIYNFRSIRADLESKGHRFKTESDTEVLLHAYQEWGEDCLQYLRGMFAFAIWNPSRKELFLARDRVGIKPLYYTEFNGGFYFGSEVKSLLEIPGVPRKLNLKALSRYLTFRYTPGDETLFAGINKLLPGHALLARSDQPLKKWRYWNLDFSPAENLSEKEWCTRFWELFEESIKLRMISDVPLGSYLSGGLDSSLIVAAMSGLSDSPVETFSVGFQTEKFDESPYAREVASYFQTSHHELYAEQDAAAVLDDVVYHLDEPLADLAVIPTYLMARETKPHVTVVLSGEGADELLGGYPKYRAFSWSRRLGQFAPRFACNSAANFFENITLQRGLRSLGATETAQAYLNMVSVFDKNELPDLLSREVYGEVDSTEELTDLVRPYFSSEHDLLSQQLLCDFHTWLPNDLLLKNDKMTMAHGVEARVPYLDHKLVELCATIPSSFKVRLNEEKVLLRKVMQGKLPERIRKRKKTGFTVPLSQWMEGDVGKRVHKFFKPDFVKEQCLFRPECLESLGRKPLNHQYYRRQFWSIAALGLWMRRFKVDC